MVVGSRMEGMLQPTASKGSIRRYGLAPAEPSSLSLESHTLIASQAEVKKLESLTSYLNHSSYDSNLSRPVCETTRLLIVRLFYSPFYLFPALSGSRAG